MVAVIADADSGLNNTHQTAIGAGTATATGNGSAFAGTQVISNPDAGGAGSAFSASGNAQNGAWAMSVNDGTGNSISFGSSHSNGSTVGTGAIASSGPGLCVGEVVASCSNPNGPSAATSTAASH